MAVMAQEQATEQASHGSAAQHPTPLLDAGRVTERRRPQAHFRHAEKADEVSAWGQEGRRVEVGARRVPG